MDPVDVEGGHAALLDALDRRGAEFGILDGDGPLAFRERVASVRRRRGRLADEAETGYRDVVLVEHDGVLLWQTATEPIASGMTRAGFSRRRGVRRAVTVGAPLRHLSVPVLEPNEYLRHLRDTDNLLNARCAAGLRRVISNGSGGFELSEDGMKPKYAGRTLVMVHGTFSSSEHLLNEFAATEAGRKFLADALRRYDQQVLMFDHPTLSVSPFINGLDLARALAGSSGEIDVIAHSRGGLVARWWLEVFGRMLAGAQVRLVVAGSPLRGTSLASPARIQPLLNVLVNVGSFVSRTLGIAAASNPFTLASFALLKFIVHDEAEALGVPPVRHPGARPDLDAAVAVIPGLQGQAAVDNNAELQRLRKQAASVNVRYFALTADFEPARIGWQLWKVVTQAGTLAADMVADTIFPGENDLVVDTAHMTSLADARDIGDVEAFDPVSLVHHCNYFRQDKTIDALRRWLTI